MVESYLALAYAMGCPTESPRLELSVTEAEKAQGEAIWTALGLPSDGRVVALNSNGAFGAAKVWPIVHCAALARQVVERFDHDVLVLCGPQERERARQIVQEAGSSRVVSLADQPVSLAATKACLARSRLLVSTDSGPRHVAAALDRPVVTLLGPTLPIWIENPTVHGPLVRTQLDCLGCAERMCPLGHHRCMEDLRPERVLEEVASLLDAARTKAA